MKYYALSIFIFFSFFSSGQNDQDVIRYSRIGLGGTSRFVGMGGAYGAVGADLSAAAYNPAGLAVYRKGDLNFAAGLRMTNNTGKIYNTTTALTDAKFVFNNFGIAGAWPGKQDPDNRHVFAFTNTQLQNFSSSIRMGGNTNSQSVARDMLNQADGKTLDNLNNSYEGLGYDTFLLDYDSINNKYFSFIDVNRTVSQTRDLVTTGRVNDLNFSYAYTYKDKYYLGLSLAFPQVDYSSTVTHIETDEKDSMRVTVFADNTYTTTYSEGLPRVYRSRLGFHSMAFEEYFKTSGAGFNLKLGGIVRVNDFFRIGGYYHTPTIYRLTDQYATTMSVAFDAAKSKPETYSYPESGGTFSYRILTPARLSLNGAFIIRKLAAIAIDYEVVNYRNGSVKSNNVSDFADVNTDIQRMYKPGHNLRVGAEYNIEPFKIRAGYNMNGSPFGDVFTGEFVRNTFSLGFGFHTVNNFYFDVVWAQSISYEDYYLFTTLNTMSKLKYSASTVAATVGIKF